MTRRKTRPFVVVALELPTDLHSSRESVVFFAPADFYHRRNSANTDQTGTDAAEIMI